MNLSPDGIYYLRDAIGIRTPAPYPRRWLLPRLLGPSPSRWRAATYLSLAATPAAAYALLTAFLAPSQAILAAVLLAALPGMWRCPLRFPVLTDAPSFAGALAVAALAAHGHPLAAALASLPLGATRETAPVFAALWAWHPAPLIGLLAAGWLRPAAPPDAPWLAHPIREALALRRRLGLDPTLYLWPWGGALVGVAYLDARGWLTVAAAYAQLAIAQDAIRLYVWAAPALVIGAAHVLGSAWGWWALAIVVTVVQRDARV